MGGGWSALGDSETKDKRSYAEAVREPGLQQQARRRAQEHRTNDDGTGGSSETGTFAPEPARLLPAKNGQRKTLLLQARARTARMEEELETIKVRLVHEQHQRMISGGPMFCSRASSRSSRISRLATTGLRRLSKIAMPPGCSPAASTSRRLVPRC